MLNIFISFEKYFHVIAFLWYVFLDVFVLHFFTLFGPSAWAASKDLLVYDFLFLSWKEEVSK